MRVVEVGPEESSKHFLGAVIERFSLCGNGVAGYSEQFEQRI